MNNNHYIYSCYDCRKLKELKDIKIVYGLSAQRGSNSVSLGQVTTTEEVFTHLCLECVETRNSKN